MAHESVTGDRRPETSPPSTPAVDSDKRVEPLELFFDLVFVFAITQVTARLADAPTWGGP